MIELELIKLGHRLRDIGSKRLDWRDLYVLIRGWQKEPHNPLGAAINGFDLWTVGEQLLAEAVDVLQRANWQRANKPYAPKPKRITRPWEKSKNTRRLGRDPIPISQFDDWWEAKAEEANRV